MLRTSLRLLPMPSGYHGIPEYRRGLRLNASSDCAAREGAIVSQRNRGLHASETRPAVHTITLSARNKRASEIHSRYANARHLPCVSLVPTTCPRSALTSHLGLKFGQLQRPWAAAAEGQVPAPRSRLRSNVARDDDAQSGQLRTGESWQSDNWLQSRLA